MNEVAVVVCTYTRQRLHLLQNALASLQAQGGVTPEVIVVVDGDARLEAELAASPLGFRLKVIPSRGPQGLSAARNTGIEATDAELVAFLDDDATADPEWLARLVAAFDDPRVMVAGGTVLPDFAAPRPCWWPDELDWVIGCSYPGQLPGGSGPQAWLRDPEALPVRPVRNVIGASMMVRKALFAAVGPFSLGLGRVGKVPLGGEETELCIRAARSFGPGSVVLVPRSVVHHHVPTERLRLAYLHARCYAEGVSKATLARLVRSPISLASESAFVLRILPRAAMRHLGAVLRGELSGFARVGILLSATFVAGLGWIRGQAARLTAAPAGGDPPSIEPDHLT